MFCHSLCVRCATLFGRAIVWSCSWVLYAFCFLPFQPTIRASWICTRFVRFIINLAFYILRKIMNYTALEKEAAEGARGRDKILAEITTDLVTFACFCSLWLQFNIKFVFFKCFFLLRIVSCVWRFSFFIHSKHCELLFFRTQYKKLRSQHNRNSFKQSTKRKPKKKRRNSAHTSI